MADVSFNASCFLSKSIMCIILRAIERYNSRLLPNLYYLGSAQSIYTVFNIVHFFSVAVWSVVICSLLLPRGAFFGFVIINEYNAMMRPIKKKSPLTHAFIRLHNKRWWKKYQGGGCMAWINAHRSSVGWTTPFPAILHCILHKFMFIIFY